MTIDSMKLDNAQGCLLGLAVGDALGTTLEFRPRDSYDELTDIIGGGPFDLKPGEWTDDTSMALCLGYSLLDTPGFDSRGQLTNYWKWYTEGYCSSNGKCFDIGNTVNLALHNFHENGVIRNNFPDSMAGNGSLMRLAPIPIYYHCFEYNVIAMKQLIRYAAKSSETTHANACPVQACKVLAIMINRALLNCDKSAILKFDNDMIEKYGLTNDKIKAVVLGSYVSKKREQIRSSGYVVDSLEAALWCFYHGEDFKSSVILAANLGDDADTTAAICGQLAGAYYGLSDIPKKWVDICKDSSEILSLARRLFESNNRARK